MTSPSLLSTASVRVNGAVSLHSPMTRRYAAVIEAIRQGNSIHELSPNTTNRRLMILYLQVRDLPSTHSAVYYVRIGFQCYSNNNFNDEERNWIDNTLRRSPRHVYWQPMQRTCLTPAPLHKAHHDSTYKIGPLHRQKMIPNNL